MENTGGSFISEYKFIKDANNYVISAVFPMYQHLKKENNKRMILGGSIEKGTNRFDELGIPSGLYLEPTVFSNDNIKPKFNKFAIMDDQLFDKLLASVSTVKPYAGTRKKYHSPNQKKIKNNSKKKTN
jgi:hypothetical protein